MFGESFAKKEIIGNKRDLTATLPFMAHHIDGISLSWGEEFSNCLLYSSRKVGYLFCFILTCLLCRESFTNKKIIGKQERRIKKSIGRQLPARDKNRTIASKTKILLASFFLLFKKKCFHNCYFFFKFLATMIASKTDIPQIQGTMVTLVAPVRRMNTIIKIIVPLIKSFATCWQETKYSQPFLQTYVYLDNIKHFLRDFQSCLWPIYWDSPPSILYLSLHHLLLLVHLLVSFISRFCWIGIKKNAKHFRSGQERAPIWTNCLFFSKIIISVISTVMTLNKMFCRVP